MTSTTTATRTFARLTAAALIAAVALTGCNNDEREVKDLKAQVQRAYGEKRFSDGLKLSEQGLRLSLATFGDKHTDSLFFAQVVSDNYIALGNKRMAAQALTREINMRVAAGQKERDLQQRRTLAIKYAMESDDFATVAANALIIARDIGMGPGKDPQPVYRPEDMYPADLYTRGVEGDVEVNYSLNASGAVADARVVRSNPPQVLDRAALDGFRRWWFTPMLDGAGNPVPTSGHIFTVAFRTRR